MMNNERGGVATLSFGATDVTGYRRMDVEDLQPSTPAGAVATALAERMALPRDVTWTLRDSRSRILDDRTPIGEQIAPHERVTLTPRTHLGRGTRGGTPVV